MAERSWKAFSAQQAKYGSLHSSKDFRRKREGVLSRLKSFLGGLFGR
ncbi:MAG: hypothetical protein PHF51_01240 [Candidatus ainarchaeum sp.]|nr:hypothetical protein [Candidatus ainarchaeum sp.]